MTDETPTYRYREEWLAALVTKLRPLSREALAVGCPSCPCGLEMIPDEPENPEVTDQA